MTASGAGKASRGRLATLAWAIPATVGLLFVVVLAAKWLRGLEPVQAFLTRYPGETDLPGDAPVGFPAWLAWQHFLNAFFILLIIRSGWQVRTVKRPPAYWTPKETGPFRAGNRAVKISLHLWLHLSVDLLWVLNGVIFIVLVFASGQWMRIVPTSWEIFPGAVSTAIQYASLDWPTANGWVNYNSLQLLAYFTTVFVAAPLAILSGLRMSPLWPTTGVERLNRAYPMKLARGVHFPVMLYFVVFIVVHVTLVFATGALRNLNHMYAVQDNESWTGFWIFAASLVILLVAWVAARPLLIRPIAGLTGTVTR